MMRKPRGARGASDGERIYEGFTFLRTQPSKAIKRRSSCIFWMTKLENLPFQSSRWGQITPFGWQNLKIYSSKSHHDEETPGGFRRIKWGENQWGFAFLRTQPSKAIKMRSSCIFLDDKTWKSTLPVIKMRSSSIFWMTKPQNLLFQSHQDELKLENEGRSLIWPPFPDPGSPPTWLQNEVKLHLFGWQNLKIYPSNHQDEVK